MKRAFLVLIVSLAASGFAGGQAFAEKSSGVAPDHDEALFTRIAVKLDLTGSIVQVSLSGGMGGIYLIGRQRLSDEVFQLRVAGPKFVPLSLDPIPWYVYSKYKLSLPVDYLTPASSEAWTARR
jgi:hypothetical protein